MVHSARAVPIDHRMTLFSLVDSCLVGTLIVIYLGGWLPVTLAAYAAGKRLRDPHAPAKYPVMVSLVAGALWPLLVVGLIELSSAMVFTDAPANTTNGIGVFA